jgi:CBS domain-containing protein
MAVGTNEWQKHHPWEPSPLSHPEPVPLVKPADLFNPMLTIADIMQPEAPTCAADALLAEAARILRDTASEAVFVVGEGQPVGLVTDRQIALAVADHADNLCQLRAQDVMKHRVPMVRADDRLDALLDKFADEGVAVVDDEGRIQGVVRWLELLGHLSERALGKLVVNLFSPRGAR